VHGIVVAEVHPPVPRGMLEVQVGRLVVLEVQVEGIVEAEMLEEVVAGWLLDGLYVVGMM